MEKTKKNKNTSTIPTFKAPPPLAGDSWHSLKIIRADEKTQESSK